MAQTLRSLSVPQTRKWPTCHLQNLIKRKQSITFDNKGPHYTIQSQHVLKLKYLYILRICIFCYYHSKRSRTLGTLPTKTICSALICHIYLCIFNFIPFEQSTAFCDYLSLMCHMAMTSEPG